MAVADERAAGKHIEERDKRERSSTALWDECVGSYERFRELVNGGDRDWVGADALQAKCARLGNDVDRVGLSSRPSLALSGTDGALERRP